MKILTAVSPIGKKDVLSKEESYPCYSPTVIFTGPELNKTMFLVILLENIPLILRRSFSRQHKFTSLNSDLPFQKGILYVKRFAVIPSVISQGMYV